jgi:hypothetical protein
MLRNTENLHSLPHTDMSWLVCLILTQGSTCKEELLGPRLFYLPRKREGGLGKTMRILV